MTTSTVRPPRWAVFCAWLVPLTILPSAIWRLSILAGDEHSIRQGGWYLILLSVLSLSLGLLTLGLVQRWGEVLPHWVPLVGGRAVPPRLASGVALAGGLAVIAVCLWGVFHAQFGVDRGPVLIGDDRPAEPPPGTGVMLLYAPMNLWGPLLILLALDYYRRQSDAAGS